MNHRLRAVAGGKTVDEGIFDKFTNKDWAKRVVLSLLVIEKDPDQRANAEAILEALAGISKNDSGKLRVVE